MHPNPRRILPVILLVVIGASAFWYYRREQPQGDNGALVASGTIEGTQVVIAPELGGRVLEVLVGEGDLVQAGQALVRFDDALLRAQLRQARASLLMAQANYDLAARGSTEEQRRVAIASAQLELINAEQAFRDLRENANLAEAQLQDTIAAIDRTRDKAQQYMDNVKAAAEQTDVDAAWATLVIAQDKLEKAQEDFRPYEKKDPNNLTRAQLQAKLSAAQQQYDAAESRYNNLVGQSNRYELAVAEAEVALAEAQLADAQRQYEQLEDGIDPDTLALAQARLHTAEANLAAARAGTSPEQLAVAQAQVEVAQGAVDVIQAQIEKLLVSTPIDGVVLVRMAEPGEVLVAGAPLLTLLQLEDLTITVYVPEDRYGAISVGQAALVRVDSFPGERFNATVAHIADQAEFTPRNVQTEEGRRTTVFAVELVVENQEDKLKPGMPADVTFDQAWTP
jgi:HlyD family secretion protein